MATVIYAGTTFDVPDQFSSQVVQTIDRLIRDRADNESGTGWLIAKHGQTEVKLLVGREIPIAVLG
ncbi:hypothetical protein Q6348_07980 [Isoptericola sp. b441]|uniref:Uncharacterized protein n=1 Tax=Actinotalea lenta TaxID=3064654 RepID=A0ABT9D8C2_9CELL|nr:hypothetical protein [Isoptericola sp. b441]MDO8107133.1 hypothetical protein [Isoptericola sp. b441]